jgi:outer membrane protein assembly factor BamB
LVNIENGQTLWDAELPARNFLYNTTWNKEYSLWIHDEKIYVLNSKNGQKIKEISLSDNVVVTEYSENLKKYIKRINVDLNSEGVDVAPNFYSNILIGNHLYFSTMQTHPNRFEKTFAMGQNLNGPDYSVARVNLESDVVEYLEIPVDISDDNFIWRTIIPSGTENSRGIDVAEDRRAALSGWFRCFNANPIAVNSTLYFTFENGMTYTFDLSASDWDETAFISLNDMGGRGRVRTLSHPLVIGDRIYHRTAKALFCIKED